MKLREQEQFLTKLLRNFPNGSVNVFDRQLRYVLAEGRGLEKVGLSPQQLVGKTLYELFPPESLSATVSFYQKAFAGEECEFEFSWSGYTYKMHVAPLEEEDGRVTLIIALAQDITERKRAEEERERVEARNRFLVRLDDAIRPLDDPAEITLTAARTLGQHLDVDRCAYAATSRLMKIR